MNPIFTSRYKANDNVDIYDATTNTLIASGVADSRGMIEVALPTQYNNNQALKVITTSVTGQVAEHAANAPDAVAPLLLSDSLSANGLVVSGTVDEPGSAIRIIDADTGHYYGVGLAGDNGSFSVDLDQALVQGEKYLIEVNDGRTNITIVNRTSSDLIAPDAPTDVEIDQNTGATLTGKTEPDAYVQVYEKDTDNVIAVGEADENGNFSIPLNPALIDLEEVDVTASDAAGNESGPSEAQAPDLTAPDVPVDVAIDPETGKTISGQTEPNAQIRVLDSQGREIATGVADGSGKFILPLSPALIDEENVTVTATDDAGNESGPAPAQAPDLTAPDAPTAQFNAQGSQIFGTSEPNSTVEVYDRTGKLLSQVEADANGNYVAPLNPALVFGEQVAVVAKDDAGNISQPTVAEAPTLLDAEDNYDNAQVHAGYVSDVETKYTKDFIKLNWFFDLFGLARGTKGEATFTVGENEIQNVLVTAKSTSLAGLFDRINVTLQVQNSSGKWVDVSEATNPGWFNILGLFNENGQLSLPGLTEGKYKLKVDAGNLVSLLGSMSFDVAQEIHTLVQDVEIVDVLAAEGNVITDNDAQAGKDVVTPNTVVSVVNGVNVAATGVTVIKGNYGVLEINAQGDYKYTPALSVQATGKQEQFKYTISDNNGNATDQATLFIDITGAQIDAVDNSAEAHVDSIAKYEVTTAQSTVVNKSYWYTSGLFGNNGSATENAQFSVRQGFEEDLTIVANSSRFSKLYDQLDFILYKQNSVTNNWDVVGTSDDFGLFTVISASSNQVRLEIEDITAGNYLVQTKVSDISMGSRLQIDFQHEYTNLTPKIVYEVSEAQGNVITNVDDNLGKDVVTKDTKLTEVNGVAVSQDNGDVTSIQGQFGVLHVNAQGDYRYTPKSTSASAGQHEDFVYTITDSANQIQDSATLHVGISGTNVNGDEIAAGNPHVRSLSADVFDFVEPTTEVDTISADTISRTNPLDDTFNSSYYI